MRISSLLLLAATFTIPIAASARTPDAPPCGGEIVRVSDGAPVAWSALLNTLKSSDMVAFGERHGILAHPQAAGCALAALAKMRPVTLVVEHINADKQTLIDTYRAGHPEDVSGLGEALTWARSGWPAWPVYEPLFAAAWASGAPVRAGDRPKQAPRPSREEILAALGANGEQILEDWRSIMNDAHCGMIDDEQAKKMAVFQATRDLAMAEAISDAASTGNLVVFYSGNEHTRKDQAVPYLAAKRGVTPAISISLQETTDGGKTLDRAEILKEIKGRYDYVWFIGEGLGIDHCAELTPGRMKRAD